MTTSARDEVRAAVLAAVDEINEGKPATQRLEASEDAVLFGEAGVLDSLGLVNFIVATEQEIEARLGVILTLADERAMTQERSPFETVCSLIDYATMLVEEASDR